MIYECFSLLFVFLFVSINYKKKKQLIKSSKKVSIIVFWALLIELFVNIFLQAEKEGINFFSFYRWKQTRQIIIAFRPLLLSKTS